MNFKPILVLQGKAAGALILLHPEHTINNFNACNEDNLTIEKGQYCELSEKDYGRLIEQDRIYLEAVEVELDDETPEQVIKYFYRLIAPNDPNEPVCYVDILS